MVGIWILPNLYPEGITDSLNTLPIHAFTVFPHSLKASNRQVLIMSIKVHPTTCHLFLLQWICFFREVPSTLTSNWHQEGICLEYWSLFKSFPLPQCHIKICDTGDHTAMKIDMQHDHRMNLTTVAICAVLDKNNVPRTYGGDVYWNLGTVYHSLCCLKFQSKIPRCHSMIMFSVGRQL